VGSRCVPHEESRQFPIGNYPRVSRLSTLEGERSCHVRRSVGEEEGYCCSGGGDKEVQHEGSPRFLSGSFCTLRMSSEQYVYTLMDSFFTNGDRIGHYVLLGVTNKVISGASQI